MSCGIGPLGSLPVGQGEASVEGIVESALTCRFRWLYFSPAAGKCEVGFGAKLRSTAGFMRRRDAEERTPRPNLQNISVWRGKFRGCGFPLTRVQGPHLALSHGGRPHGRDRLEVAAGDQALRLELDRVGDRRTDLHVAVRSREALASPSAVLTTGLHICNGPGCNPSTRLDLSIIGSGTVLT